MNKKALWIIPTILLATALIIPGIVKAQGLTVFAVSPQVIDITRQGGPVLAGSTFSVNLTTADAPKLWGYEYWLAYNSSILTVTDFRSYSPFTQATPSAISDATYLYVDTRIGGENVGFNATYTDWTLHGNEPYLMPYPTVSGLPHYPTNYISTTDDGAKVGDFFFAYSGAHKHGENLGGHVYIEMNATGDGDDYVEIWLYNGTAFDKISTITPDTTFDFKSSADVGYLFPTTVYNATVYLVKRTVGTANEIIVDSMRLKLDTGYVRAGFTSFFGDPNGLTVGTTPATIGTVDLKVNANGTTRLDLQDSGLVDTTGHKLNLAEVDGYFSNTEEIKLHDVGITEMTVSPTTVRPGDTINISVKVQNVGIYNETFKVGIDYNGNAIGDNKTVTNLQPDQSTTLDFTWAVRSTLSEGEYTLSARIFSADDQNSGNNAKSTTITVSLATSGGQLFQNFIYIAAGIVIIVVVIGIIYVLMRRRRK